MFQLSTYKGKNIALLAGTIIILILAYPLSFSNTFEAFRDLKNISKELELAEIGKHQLVEQKKQLSYLNMSLGNLSSINQSAQDTILDLLAIYSDSSDLRIKSFPETIHHDYSGFQIETNKIEIQGSFKSLVKLCYLIEYKEKVSRLSSVHFKKVKDYNSKKTLLVAELYFQNLKI